MTAISGKITGKVQGVGLRMYIFRQAERLGIYGWVRNCADGSVELHAQGGDVDLDFFTTLIKRGTHFSEIKDVEITKSVINPNFKCFEVKM